MADLELEAPDDPRRIGDYVPFSVWSLIALVMGFVACLALLDDSLYYLGLLGMVAAVIGLADALPASRRKAGVWLALCGLFLSLFSATASAVHHKLFQNHRAALARQYAEQWLEMLRQNDLYRAYELTIEYPRRQPANTDLKLYYEGESSLLTAREGLMEEFRFWLEGDPERSIRNDGDQFQFAFIGVDRVINEPKVERYYLSFWGDHPTDPKRRKFGIEVRRANYIPPIGPQWNIVGAYGIDPFIQKKIVGREIDSPDRGGYK